MTGCCGLLGGLTAVLVLLAVGANALPPQKIIGGTAAAQGEFPYQAVLKLGHRHLCGGTIVSDRHIITAAHCIVGIVSRPFRDLQIATGSVTSYGGRSYRVSDAIPHPGYRVYDKDSLHDIAVIVLASRITFDKNQQKIELPTEPTPGGADAIATGWGHTSAMQQGLSLKLMKVSVTTLDTARCDKYFTGMSNVGHSHLCTFDGHGRGTCPGDSGGPLACNGKLIGVVSYGVPCAVGYPDVYTNVHYYLDWIKKTMALN